MDKVKYIINMSRLEVAVVIWCSHYFGKSCFRCVTSLFHILVLERYRHLTADCTIRVPAALIIVEKCKF